MLGKWFDCWEPLGEFELVKRGDFGRRWFKRSYEKETESAYNQTNTRSERSLVSKTKVEIEAGNTSCGRFINAKNPEAPMKSANNCNQFRLKIEHQIYLELRKRKRKSKRKNKNKNKNRKKSRWDEIKYFKERWYDKTAHICQDFLDMQSGMDLRLLCLQSR